MTARRALLLAAIVLLAFYWWNRGKTLRPHEALRAGDDLYRAGRRAEAELLYERALEKAQLAELGVAGLKVYFDRLVQITAEGDRLDAAAAHFEGLERVGPADQWVGGAIRGAHNLAVLHFRRRQLAEADRLLSRAVDSIGPDGTTGTEPKHEEFTMRLFLWMHRDRVHAAQGAAEAARLAFRHALGALQLLGQFGSGRYWPLRPGVRHALTRYASFLKTVGREEEARRLEDEVQRIESQAASPLEAVCVTYLAEAPMGCLLEIGPETRGP